MIPRWGWIVLGLGLLAAGIFLAVPERTGSAPERVLRLNVGTEPPTLDWSLATDSVSLTVISNLMEGLTEFDEQLNPRPNLAERWEILDNGRRYLFHLRKDAIWSDGRPVVAEEYEYSWKRLLDPKTAAEYAYFLYDVEGAEAFNNGTLADPERVGVKALGPLLLEVRLRKPVVFFPALVTFPITFPQRPDLIERYGEAWTDPAHLVVNGPFLLDRWWHEYKIELTPNPRYVKGRPAIDRIHLYMVQEGSVALTLYETGDLDVTAIPPVAIPSYSRRPDYVNAPVLRNNYVGFNVTKPPFHDPRVRRAFGHAIDRSIFPKILQGGELPATSWIPLGMFAHHPSLGLSFDPARAKALMAEAGYPEGKGFPSATLEISTDPVARLIAEELQAQWKRHLGMQVAINTQEWKVFLKRVQQDPPPLFRLGWGADYPDPDNFMAMFTSGSGNNHTRWLDERFDTLVARAAMEADRRRRQALYDEAQRLLLEETAAIVPIFLSAQNRLVRPEVKNFPHDPLDLWILKRVSIEEKEN
ncbi:MAG: peptide ABC transporter substrate-binding protein [Nitrospirae bacterium]|nr:peptide ABC transporter substrate-binding protein [Nitrospirota bacterium]